MVLTPRLLGRRGPTMMSPFIRVSGKVIYMPPIYATVQTDASYFSESHHTRVATILKPSILTRIQQRMRIIQNASSSTEAEWCAVVAGLEFALEHGEEAIALENDNLGVIHGLITPGMMFRHDYARHYKQKFMNLAEHTQWVGARWIPREINKADKLFRGQLK